MSFFGSLFRKKGESNKTACGCSCGCGEATCAPETGASFDGSKPIESDKTVVKVLGTGCKKCHALHENALKAAESSEKAIVVEYVTDIAEIAAAGVMNTPALMVDGTVVSTGKLLSVEEVGALL